MTLIIGNKAIPQPTSEMGMEALRSLLAERSLMRSLQVLHRRLGDVFQIKILGFNPIFLVGPEATRFLLATHRDQFLWRQEGDPVTKLLNRGVLVVDGDEHDDIRKKMNPAFHKRFIGEYVNAMLSASDRIIDTWLPGATVDMLVEMRKITLLIIVDALSGYSFEDDLEAMWKPILKSIKYISPGLWTIWPKTPRFGFKKSQNKLDDFLYTVIREKRNKPGASNNLFTLLQSDPDMTDSLLRDQFLTMLIAGHDTSTALLAWALFLLGKHPEAMNKAVKEVETVLRGESPSIVNIQELCYLELVIKETLRLYPPIHLGARRSVKENDFQGYKLPANSRIVYSIYLTHRDPKHWPHPDKFIPERFENNPRPYTYLPFGGGPRNCIGASFAMAETKIILARILQKVSYQLLSKNVRLYMGATLEPRPGVKVRITSNLMLSTKPGADH